MTSNLTYFLMIVLGCFISSSCEEDSLPLPESEITFMANISNEALPATRSAEFESVSTMKVECDDKDTVFLHTICSDSIAFVPSKSFSDSLPVTRGNPVSSMYDVFSVSAYTFPKALEGINPISYIDDVPAHRTGNSYTLSPTYDWPGSTVDMQFFSYAPIAAAYSYDGNMASPTIGVSTPVQVQEQYDLITARTEDLDGNSNVIVPLTFRHVLTAVRFVCDNDMQIKKVEEITLKNVYSDGTYHMDSAIWTHTDQVKTFTIKNPSGQTVGNLASSEQTFMMIPQVLPKDALIEIRYTDKSNIAHTMTASIAGTEWPMGWTITYHISKKDDKWEYVLDVTDPIEFTFEGGTKPCSVSSYRYDRNHPATKEAVPWKVESYSLDGGVSWITKRPEWLKNFPESGPGCPASDTPETYDCSVEKQKEFVTDASFHTEILKGTPVKGSNGNPYNLSNAEGLPKIENTANCYVVNGPGYYSIPLVYGNAIKNGVDNPSAYNYKGFVPGNDIKSKDGKPLSSHIMQTLINHEGKPIASPFIYKDHQEKLPKTAELVWQDALELIRTESIRYVKNEENGGCIEFEVPVEHICQGNAVIAIKDIDGNVMWSWHIWVTDQDLDIESSMPITNSKKIRYNLMPVNLGWCDSKSTIYKERSCLVKISSEKCSKVVTLHQNPSKISEIGNHTSYNWGRKDPFIPALGVNISKKWYNKENPGGTDGFPKGTQGSIDGTKFTGDISGMNEGCIQKYILFPEQMHQTRSPQPTEDQWGDAWYLNLWNSNNIHVGPDNNDPVVKTVYDPCPVGYVVPPSNIFSGFTQNGKDINPEILVDQLNGTYYEERHGFEFNVDDIKSSTIFFCISGYRFYTGYGEGIGTIGFCWTSTSAEIQQESNPPCFKYSKGQCFAYQSDYVNPKGIYDRSFGFAIRPMIEKN